MALLQDQEARIKKQEDRRRLYGTIVTQIATGFVFASVLISGALILFVLYAVSPNSHLLSITSGSSSDRLVNGLSGVIHQGAETILPGQATIDAIRAKIDNGTFYAPAESGSVNGATPGGKTEDFAILASPDIKTTGANSTVTYDVRVIRSKDFHEPISLTATDLPGSLTINTQPVTLTGDQEAATIDLSIPAEAKAGSYTFNILAKATTKERTVNASLAVSTLSILNPTILDIRPMDVGSKWQATIGWETNAPANTWLEYTPDSYFSSHAQTYEFTSSDLANSTGHTITLYYLEPDTIYHYRMKNVDTINNLAVGADRAFVTSSQ
ncbi:MAG: hypothetical protein V1778_02030 [bacterium]